MSLSAVLVVKSAGRRTFAASEDRLIMIYEKRNYPAGDSFPFSAAVMGGDQGFMVHCHREMEIMLSESGSFFVSSAGQKIEVREGEILIIPPFVTHEIFPTAPENRRSVVLLDLALIGSSPWPGGDMEDMEKLPALRSCHSRSWDGETTGRVTEAVRELLKEYVRKQEGWQLAVKILVNRLLLIALREMPEAGSGADVPKDLTKLAGILGFIAVHYTGDVSLGECAKAVGFHPSYLSRFFHSRMGITFQEYVKQLRVDRAKWLLRSRDMTVTEIAFASGFRDIQNFNKMFRLVCGMTPTEFREREGAGRSG